MTIVGYIQEHHHRARSVWSNHCFQVIGTHRTGRKSNTSPLTYLASVSNSGIGHVQIDGTFKWGEWEVELYLSDMFLIFDQVYFSSIH